MVLVLVLLVLVLVADEVLRSLLPLSVVVGPMVWLLPPPAPLLRLPLPLRASGLALPLAAYLGFDMANPSSAASLRAIDWVGLILPGVIGVGGAVVLWNYPITRERHATLQKWLARRALRASA